MPERTITQAEIEQLHRLMEVAKQETQRLQRLRAAGAIPEPGDYAIPDEFWGRSLSNLIVQIGPKNENTPRRQASEQGIGASEAKAAG